MISKWKLNRTPVIALFFTLAFLFSCRNSTFKDQHVPLQVPSRLEKIIERGRLIAVTDMGSASYFLYRGEPMGYQYELLRSFTDHLGVRLEIHVESDPETALEKLSAGEYDVVAKMLAITRERKDKADFSEPMMQTRQVLVQRKPANWRKMPTTATVEQYLIRNPLNLGGKTVHVQRNSAQYYRLMHLQQEIGSAINVVEMKGYDTEQLIQMVAAGEIEYTVCDEVMGKIAEKLNPDVDASTVVSLPQFIGWAVGKGNQSLLDTLNYWWRNFSQTAHAKLIYNRYFDNPNGLHAGQREFHSRSSGRISFYDEILKKYSASLGWDWRLVASLVYQESKFKNDVVSHKGAFGIMQMLPTTAEMFGIDSSSTPYEHIVAGIRYLKMLDNQLKEVVPDSDERQKFVLAAYNAGIAHVYDARRLAIKNNKNPNIWDGNVDYFLLNKSKPEYYQDNVVQYGFCRGEEPYRFVNEIFERYQHYRNVVKN